jgi:hypothetical protein
MWIFIIPAVIFIAVIYHIWVYADKKKHYYKVKATVVGNEVATSVDEMSGATSEYFYAIFEFTDKKGVKQTFVSGEDSPDRPAYKEGDKVVLLVHPADPSKFLEYDFADVYGIPLVGVAVGAFALFMCLKYGKY